MTKFKILAKTALEILELTQASGRNVKGENKELLNDCIMKVEKDTVSIHAIDENEVLIILITAKIGKESVIEQGKIPINLKTAIPTLKRFESKDIVTIAMEGDLLTFERAKPKLKVKITTIAPDSVKSDLPEHPFKYDQKEDKWFTEGGVKMDSIITLEASEFAEIVKDGEQIQHRSFPFTISKDSVMVIVEDIDSGAQIVRELTTKSIKLKEEEVASLYSYGFGNAFANLTGDLKIWIGNENPMAIQKKSDEYELTYILTSSQQQGEEEEEETSEPKEEVENPDDVAEELIEEDIPDPTEEELAELEDAFEPAEPAEPAEPEPETKKKGKSNGKKV